MGGGQKILSSSLFDAIVANAQLPVPPHEPLTPREEQVLALLIQGGTNQEIAATLHLSPQTVRNYAHGIYQKLQVRTRTELILLFSKQTAL